MKITDWLNSNVKSGGPTILQYLAELIYCNGGSMVAKGFGNVQPNIGAYGRIGLTVQEAFYLTELSGTLNGMIIASEDNRLMGTVHDTIQNEIQRVEKEFLSKITIPTPEAVKAIEKSRIIIP